MSNSFGTKFILVNDVQQRLNPRIFSGGPWIHLATVKRGLKEYCAFKNAKTGTTYIEEVDPSDPGLFVKIKEDAEWADLYRFLGMHGIFDATKPTKISE